MNAKTYCLVTFGCQMNDADSELMAGIMEAKGWRRSLSEDDADLVLFNTCVVRHGAEERAVARLNRLKPIKMMNPGKIVGVCGCLAQQDGERLLERLPHVDLIMGTRAIPQLGVLVDEIEATGEPRVATDIQADPSDTPVSAIRRAGVVGRINIIFGCNKNCSYCIVPQTRGRELSRPHEDILREARGLAEAGYKEVLLIGQNVNSYRDLSARDGATNGEMDLAGLLEKVNAIDGIERIRFVTSHPRDANERMFRAMAELEKVCESLHLPVQSGSSAVLKKMYRGYSRERYLQKIEMLRSYVPDIALSTDVIVGFPGETDADFEDTMSLMREVRYDLAYMFIYSPRQNTPAAEFADDVPMEVKKERLTRLIDLHEQIAAEKNKTLEGTRVEVLAERSAPRTAGALAGRSRGDKTVVFPGTPDQIGHLMEVVISSSTGHTLVGRPSISNSAIQS